MTFAELARPHKRISVTMGISSGDFKERLKGMKSLKFSWPAFTRSVCSWRLE
jgi:hypothetical protein